MLLASEKWDGLPWQVRELPLKRQILLNRGWNRGSLMILGRMFVCLRVYVDVCVGVGFSDPATEPDWCWEEATQHAIWDKDWPCRVQLGLLRLLLYALVRIYEDLAALLSLRTPCQPGAAGRNECYAFAFNFILSGFCTWPQSLEAAS